MMYSFFFYCIKYQIMNYQCATKRCEDDMDRVQNLAERRAKEFNWEAFAKDLIWIDSEYGFDPFMTALQFAPIPPASGKAVSKTATASAIASKTLRVARYNAQKALVSSSKKLASKSFTLGAKNSARKLANKGLAQKFSAMGKRAAVGKSAAQKIKKQLYYRKVKRVSAAASRKHQQAMRAAAQNASRLSKAKTLVGQLAGKAKSKLGWLLGTASNHQIIAGNVFKKVITGMYKELPDGFGEPLRDLKNQAYQGTRYRTEPTRRRPSEKLL